jgi:hypothetical protein
MSILQLWYKFSDLSWRRRSLLLEAAFWLIVARSAVAFVCFPRIAHHIGRLHAPIDLQTNSNQDWAVAREVSWAIDRSARLLPLRLVCLPRALAAWQMLHLRGIWSRVHCGALRDPERTTLTTHAWVDACGVEVTGYPEAYHCVEIGFFAQ